jgi:hypothetical protein
MSDIKESDWKYMRNLKKTLLDRLCNRILDNLQAESNVQKREPDVHQQYLKVYQLIKKWDKMIADCFDDWSRGNLIFNILFLIKYQVITNEEIEQLSDETKERIKFHLDS